MGRALIVFWLPIAVGVLVGKAFGGKLAYVGALDVKRIWVLPLAVAAQAVVVLPAPVPPEHAIDPMRYVLPLTTGAVCVWAALNRALPGMWLVLLGASCNLAVICANGGLMPTNADALALAGKHESLQLSQAHPGIRLVNSKDILLPPEETQLRWLSDIIVSPPLPQRKVMSVGDLILAAGLAYLAGRVTYAPLTNHLSRSHSLAAGARTTFHPTIPITNPDFTQEIEHGAPDSTPPRGPKQRQRNDRVLV